MKLKNIMILSVAAVLCLTCLASCKNQNQETNPTQTENAAAELAPGTVLASVDGEDIAAGEFGYYVYNAAMLKAAKENADIENFDWSKMASSGKPLRDEIIDDALNAVMTEKLLIQFASRHGVTFDDADVQDNISKIDEFVSQNGEEAFLLNANALGIHSIEDYKKLSAHVFAAQKAEDAIAEKFQEYTAADNITEDLLKSHKNDTKVTAQHILIKSDSEKFSNPEETIKEVLNRAKAGEDFAALMKEFNEDPGESERGYTFGRGEMVQSFEDAAFDLDCGEISDVVKTEYGYHIIKRLPGMAELENYLLKNASVEKNDRDLSEISVVDIMKTAAEAQSKLQAQSSSNAAKSASGGE